MTSNQKAAFLRAAKRYGRDPKFDQQMRAKYHVSGPAILAKLAKGESGFDMTAVSNVGARGGTQFMPATREEFIKRYGVDAWKDPDSAVHAAKIYLEKSGLAAYNPGMPTYAQYILSQKVGKLNGGTFRGSPRSADSGNLGFSGGDMQYTATQTPATDTPSRSAAAAMVLAHSGKHLPKLGGASKLAQANYLYKSGLATERTPGSYSGKTTITPTRVTRTAGAQDDTERVTPGKGKFKISGPHPERLKPELIAFAEKVAAQAGETLTGLDGSTHSKMTVNGNVSEHWTGNATDIPARGTRLVHLGQAALIAAGMPRKEALSKTGGLFNVGEHQIIFNTHEGGDHTDHLHISTHARARK